jgi:hypothetical protein
MTAPRSALALVLSASLLLTAAPALAEESETSAPTAPENPPAALLAPAQASDAEISPPGFFATGDRDVVQDRYLDEFRSGPVPALGWTGSFGSCVAGTTNAAFRDATRDRINYYRDLAGVPSWITLSGAFNSDAQAAALIMGANNALSHNPIADGFTQCITAQGDAAAGDSNIGIGTGYYNDNYENFVPIHGPYAVDAYMEDFGANNWPVGHRRWLLCPQLQTNTSPGRHPATARSRWPTIGGRSPSTVPASVLPRFRCRREDRTSPSPSRPCSAASAKTRSSGCRNGRLTRPRWATSR